MAKLKQVKKRGWGHIINSFRGGFVSLIDVARLNLNQAFSAKNLIQEQDGLWRPRWGTAHFGLAIPNETNIIAATSYVRADGVEELIALGSTSGKFYKSSGAEWTKISDTVFSTSADHYFCQIEGRLYIGNGEDPLSYYDGSTITQYVEITKPTLSTPTRSTLSSGSFTYYYRVTALNNIGETEGSVVQSITVNKDRDDWTGAEGINLSWGSVSGAERYQVYVSDVSGQEVYIATVTATTYQDRGAAQNPYLFVPDTNTTGGPKLAQMRLSEGRIWGLEPQNPWRVWASGVGQFVTSFSPYNGAIYIDLEKGGKERPKAIVHYRSGKGDSVATILCSSPNGNGSTWQISLETITIADSSIIVPVPTKIVGTSGTPSPRAVVAYMDTIVFPNPKGVISLGNKEQMFNVLATDELSGMIRPSFRNLNLSALDKMCGHWFDQKIFFSAPEKGKSQNSTIFVYDTERKNWSGFWTTAVKEFLEYTQNGKARLLGVPITGNKLIEFDPTFKDDLGQAFLCEYISPLIYVDDNRKSFAKVQDVIFEFGRPKGIINVEVLGILKRKDFSSIKTGEAVRNQTSSRPFATGLFGSIAFGTSNLFPSSFTQPTVIKLMKIRKVLNAIQYRVWSNSVDSDWVLNSIQADGIVKKTRPPSEWK